MSIAKGNVGVVTQLISCFCGYINTFRQIAISLRSQMVLCPCDPFWLSFQPVVHQVISRLTPNLLHGGVKGEIWRSGTWFTAISNKDRDNASATILLVPKMCVTRTSIE